MNRPGERNVQAEGDIRLKADRAALSLIARRIHSVIQSLPL